MSGAQPSSAVHPSLPTDIADLILVLARWAVDPARPPEPVDLGPEGLLERLNGLHKETMSILGPVALPEIESLFGGAALPALPTMVQRMATAFDMADQLPVYNTIDAAIQTLFNGPTKRLTPSQSAVARVLLTPLERPGELETLRAAIIDAAPASAFGFVHLFNGWLHSARLEHPNSYVLGVQRQMVVDDGHLVRGGALEQTTHAGRLLPTDDPWLASIDDQILHRMLRQFDTALYLFAAQCAENGQALAVAEYDAELFDTVFRSPYSRRELVGRFFEVLRGHAGLSSWNALSLDGRPQLVGENSTTREQLRKWRSGKREMTPASLERLLEHSPGFDSGRRVDDLAVFAEGYRITLSVTAAAAWLDVIIGDRDPDPRSILLDRFPAYLKGHRADLDTWVPRSAFTSGEPP